MATWNDIDNRLDYAHPMRTLIAIAFTLVASTSAGATGPSWPITPFVDYPSRQAIGPEGGKATVRIRADDAASAIDVEIYGLDGMRAGDNNRVLVHRDQLLSGSSFEFDVTIHPGPGRSMLVVSAKAHFARAGNGGTVQAF